MINDDYKYMTETEEMWAQLGGSHYEGIQATPERYYCEMTAAVMASRPEEFIRLSQVTARRFHEIATLQQELADIQSMLSLPMTEYDRAQTA